MISYSMYTVSTLIAPFIMTKFNVKFNKLFIGAAFTYLLIIISRKIAVNCAETHNTIGICSRTSIQWIIIIISVVQGFGLSMIWVTERVYLAKCCNDFNRGSFTGLFYLIYSMSNITGSLLSS